MSKKTNFGKINGREAMVVGIIIVMVALFSILSPTFRTYSTFVSVLDMSYYIALMAIGVTFTLITGGVDLSIGTGLICYSLFGGYLIVHKDVPVVVALIACLVQAADAISAARPGARSETLESYTTRLKQLEEIADSFQGVDKTFAIQAGREIRVMVVPEQISDDDMILLARDISNQIEENLDYPGQIKVNVIRESRAVEYAK